MLTKLDGDFRGGGVLSVRSITHVPVMFVGLGEKMDDLDVFHPDRMADRILGMGDIMTLVEQAQEKMDLETSQKSARRMMEGQLHARWTCWNSSSRFKKLGSLGSMMKLIPASESLLPRWMMRSATRHDEPCKAIILSMTDYEREDPSILRHHARTALPPAAARVAEVNR